MYPYRANNYKGYVNTVSLMPMIGKKWSDDLKAEIRSKLEAEGIGVYGRGQGFKLIVQPENPYSNKPLELIHQILPRVKSKKELMEEEQEREWQERKQRKKDFIEKHKRQFDLLEEWATGLDEDLKYQIVEVFAGLRERKGIYFAVSATTWDGIKAMLVVWGIDINKLQSMGEVVDVLVQKLKEDSEND